MVHLLLVGIDAEYRLYAMNEKSDGKLTVWKIGEMELRYFGTAEADMPSGYLPFDKFPMMTFSAQAAAQGGGNPLQPPVSPIKMAPAATTR